VTDSDFFAFVRLFNNKTMVVLIFALGATHGCILMGLQADVPFGMLGTAIVFPIVFAINAAYRRREDALNRFADLKANAMALLFAHRDWVAAEHSEEVTRGLIGRVEQLFEAIGHTLAREDIEQSAELSTIYSHFSAISRDHERLRRLGVSGSELSRANQYLRQLMVDWERMRTVARYRTPRSLRVYTAFYLRLAPVLFAPYFAMLAATAGLGLAELVAAVNAVVLVSLDNIQDDLENPYDGLGPDDIQLDIARLYTQTMRGLAVPPDAEIPAT
jgi:predicted membrane chloride channel (bestrophin family)